MKFSRTMAIRVGLCSLLATLPLAAQMNHPIDFTTSFPFYAGETEMPAGTYKVTQSRENTNTLMIQSSDGTHTALVQFQPMHAKTPHAQSDVTFRKYGSTDYLNRVWVGGLKFGMRLEPSKEEQEQAANAKYQEHAVAANQR